jgi:hypothetical protein
MYSVFTKLGTKGGRCGGPEKLLDLLDVLFAPVASLGGMYSVFAKPGTKVDVDVEDRRSSLTFSMFSVPPLALPWAGCTSSSQRAVDVEERRSSLTFSMFSLPRLALPWAGWTESAQSREQRVVDVDGREMLLRTTQM